VEGDTTKMVASTMVPSRMAYADSPMAKKSQQS
jgi:hypothetical protein